MNLFRAELTRFATRKIVWIGFGLVLLALAGMITLLSFKTAPPTEAQRTEALQFYEQSRQDWEENHETYEKLCREADPPVPNPEVNCAYPEPQLSDYLRQPTFADVGPQVALIGVGLFGLATAIIASSLIGADFSSGAISNWLSFIPVRWKVYVSKVVVTVVASTVVSAVLLAGAVGVLGLIVTAQQGAAAVTGWDVVWQSYGRGIAIIAFAGILGVTVSFITRRTIAAVGIILGYVILRMLVTGVFGQTSWLGRSTPWFPESNALAVLQADYTYLIVNQTVTESGSQLDYVEKILPWEQGLVYVAVGATVLLVAGLLTFQRRDVS